MDRLDLIDLISKQAQMTNENAALALDTIWEVVSTSLKMGDPVVLANFGTFVINERVTQNKSLTKSKPAATQKITKIVGFKAGRGLKEAIKSKDR